MADRIIQMKDNQGNNLFPLVKISPSILEGNYLPITGGILTGDLILKGDPTSLLMPATKQYVDNKFATKQYVDNKFGNYLLLSGGTLTGNLWIKKNTPRLYIKDTSTSTDAHSILHFGNKDTNDAAYIFLNGPSRTDDGGVNMMTIRNNVGNLRLDNAVIVSKTLTTSQEITVVGGNGGSAGNYCQFRGISGNYGFMIRNDGVNTYFLLTDSGDEYGGWNSLRPLFIENSTGYVRSQTRIYNAVWNDYAEYRKSDDNEPGRVVMEDKKGVLQRATERLQSFAGVVSDTFGFSEGETDEAKTPLAVAGRVLVYPYRPREEYNPGDCVCAAPDGTVDIMTRQEIRDWPDRIVGTVSEIPDYKIWGTGNVEVNGRIWIKVR